MARRMRIVRGPVAFLILSLAAPAWPETRDELVPEADLFFKLNDDIRLFLNGKLTWAPASWNGGANDTELEVGPHLDVSLKPIVRHSLEKGNWERERYLWFRVGYEYTTTLGSVESPFHENRGILEVTGRAPRLPLGLWFESRERFELRDKNGKVSERFRWRTALEREAKLSGTVTMPYVRFEIFYDTSHHAWSRQTYQAGVEVTLDHRWRLEPYYLHQDDQRSQPAHTNAYGLILKHYR